MSLMFGTLMLALTCVAGMAVAGAVLMMLGWRRGSRAQFWLGVVLFSATAALVGWLIWRLTTMV